MTAASSDIDHMITQALRVEMRFAHHGFGWIGVDPKTMLICGFSVHRTIPAKNFTSWIGGEAAINFAITIGTKESGLP